MKVRIKILLGFVILGVIIVISFLLFLQIKARRDSLLIRSYQQEHELSVTTALRTCERQLKMLVTDYAFWDELVTYTRKPDTAWSTANLATVTTMQKLSGLWIFDENRKLVFSDFRPPNPLSPVELFSESLFKHLAKFKNSHYFIKQSSTIYEFEAGPVHATTDTLMLHKESGFFIIARAFDEQTLQNLEELSGSSVLIQSSPGKTGPPSDFSEMTTTVQLKSWDQQPAGYLEFTRAQPLLKSYINITLITSIFYLLFALVLLFLTSFVLYRWVYLPLKKITESLALENAGFITSLAKKRDEFGQIAFMIERFFLQKKELAQIIHEKNEALTSFADAESKNSAILSAIPDHLFRINLFGIISDYHLNRTEDFFLKKTDLIGKNIEEVLPASLLPMVQESIKELNQSKTTQSFDFSIPFPNGLRRYYDATLTLTSMGDYLAIIRNITTRKEAEIALQRMLQKEGELSRLKTQFISTVSHEFRTPLSAISSNAELLEMYDDKWSAEKKSTAFTRIQEAVSQLITLLNNLSLVARDQTGKFGLNPVEFDLEAFCKKIINDNVAAVNRPGDINLSYLLPRKQVVMDKEVVRYIVTNLVSNAIKFSPQGSGIKVTVAEAGRRQVEIKVDDEGVGIPEKDIGSIYEPFHRGANAVDYPGTGLGLSIVKRCVETHKGSILITSTPGKGTHVQVRLPEIVSKNQEP